MELALRLDPLDLNQVFIDQRVLYTYINLFSDERKFLMEVYYPWAVREGTRCSDLMSFMYEDHLTDNLDEVRRKLNLSPAPLV